MPRYFFDTDNGALPVPDDEGIELSDAEAARILAIAALFDMTRDRLPDGDRGAFAVRVRDERGTVLYSASLGLDGDWHIPSAGAGANRSMREAVCISSEP
jgi:hypothetical protein